MDTQAIALFIGIFIGILIGVWSRLPKSLSRIGNRKHSRLLMRMCSHYCKTGVPDLLKVRNRVDREALSQLHAEKLADANEDGLYSLHWDRLVEIG